MVIECNPDSTGQRGEKKVDKVEFFRGFLFRFVLFYLEEKSGKHNSKGKGGVIHNLELKESS